MDHPFVDGNKRAAFAAAEMFLRTNGALFQPPDEAVTEFVLAVARGEHDLESIASWLRAHV